MTPPEPTAEARALDLAKAYAKSSDEIPRIMAELRAFRAQGVKRAEKDAEKEYDLPDYAERLIERREQRIASLEAELARVREESKGKHLVPCPICARAESEAKP